MKTVRLTKLAACVRYWPFFAQGFQYTDRFLRYGLPLDSYRQILFNLVVQPNAWVGLCLDDNEKPLGFALAHECTPLFCPEKQYEASIVYSAQNDPAVFSDLQLTFETFCRAQGVKSYFATTRRDSGATIRCFQSPRYGFKRAYTVFIKQLH